MPVPSTMSDLSSTAASNSPAGSESPNTIDDYHRALSAIVRRTNSKGADIAAGATTDLSLTTDELITVTGSGASISSFGTMAAGIKRTLIFSASNTLIHNGTSLICPLAVNLSVSANDVLELRSLGSGNWIIAGVSRGIPTNVRNYVIGGDFSTNPWQRGTSFIGISAPVYVADRFHFELSNSGGWAVERIADAPTLTQAGKVITYCLEMRCTLADTTVAAGDSVTIGQKVEGINYLALYQRPQLIGFWAKSNVIGDYGVSLRSGDTSASFVGKITINTANTWEYKTVPVATAASVGTWDFSNGIGVRLAICLVSGTTYQTATLDAWQANNFIAPTTQVNLAAASGNYFRIADVKLIDGLVDVTPYQLTAEELLTACQRYYQTGLAHARFPAAAAGQVCDTPVYFPVQMRASPSITSTGGSRVNVGTPAIYAGSPSNVRLEIIAAAAGDAYAVNESYTADAEL